MMTTGSNCQNNCWCSSKVDIQVISPLPKANAEVSVKFSTSDRVGHVDGKYHTILDTGGEISWGDGSKTPLSGVDGITLKHKYVQAGTYTIAARIGGQFKWQSEGGSCSYNCQAGGTKNISIAPAKSKEK